MKQEFKKLETIMERSLELNQSVGYDSGDSRLRLITNAEEFINCLGLRDRVYKSAGYEQLYSSPLEGLNYDDYDEFSLQIIYTAQDNPNEILSHQRLILGDLVDKLPCEKDFNAERGFDFMRFEENYKNRSIAEISRTVRNPEASAVAWKKLFQATYDLANKLQIGNMPSILDKDMYDRLYSKWGMNPIGEKTLDIGEGEENYVISWKILDDSTPFFYKYMGVKINK